MAILQSRVIALVNAAIDYKQAYEELRNMIQSEYERSKVHLDTAGALEEINLRAQYIGLKEPGRTIATITREHEHFAHNMHRNRIQAERLRHRRNAEKPTRKHYVHKTATVNLSGLEYEHELTRAQVHAQGAIDAEDAGFDFAPPANMTPEQYEEAKKKFDLPAWRPDSPEFTGRPKDLPEPAAEDDEGNDPEDI